MGIYRFNDLTHTLIVGEVAVDLMDGEHFGVTAADYIWAVMLERLLLGGE